MGLLETGGDSTLYIRGSNGTVTIGAGNSDKVVVSPTTVNVQSQLNVNADLNATQGGMIKNLEFVYMRLLQNTTPIMSASQISLSGTAAQGNAATFYFTKVPLRNSGSVVGISLISEDGVVSGGGLTASILLNGSPLTGTDASRAFLAVASGTSLNSTNWAKDLYPFNGNSYIQVQLTGTADYLNTIAASCSWMAFVDVEY